VKILNDNSDPNKAAKDYTQLIGTDHVNFVLGPFSTLLTSAAAPVVARFGYAFPEGMGGGPKVYALKEHNLFAVTSAVVNQMVPFVDWVKSLPISKRPKTAAYPMIDDPFADPPVLTAKTLLEGAGVKTVYQHAPINPAANLTPFANAVAATGAQVVVLGSVDVPTVVAFVHAFEAAHYTPKMLIAASGPDQGLAFLNVVGPGNATGMMVPDGWYGGFANAESHLMVQNYIARYGGTASQVNADVAESYSSAQVLADAVNATRSLDNAKIIAYLHSGVTIQTVQGSAKFDDVGLNTVATSFIFQWQNSRFLQVLPTDAVGSTPIFAIKQPWLNG
jgi:branched-chain amino acid transport system substrate-binding protein